VADFVGADRGLKRLAVTPIEPADLEHPPVVGLLDGLAEAGAALDRTGAGWAVVLDDGGRPAGWLPADRAAGAGTVASAVVRSDGAVPVQASLRTALATILQTDAGWVPVLDGDRYLGVLTPSSVHATLRRSITSSASRPTPRPGAVPERR
jgi:osmoprotectant transport system ATP-binding protein